MSFDYNDKETNRLLGAANNIDIIVEIYPGPLEDTLGAFSHTQCRDTARGTKGMAP